MKGSKDVKRERIARGQCPNCGKEAAPYYLCHDCRLKGKIVRVLNRGASVGGFRKERRGRESWWSMGDGAKLDTLTFRPDPKPGDGRLAPRLRGIRVDVEATIVAIMQQLGRPVTLDEILAGWGRLRERRTAPLASDLACIIAAADKRKRKSAKLVARDAGIAERQSDPERNG